VTRTLTPIADVHARVRHVFVHGLELVMSLGVYEVERRYEQRVIISVDLAVEDRYDGVSDKLGDVLDYGHVAHGIEQIAAEGHVNLVETLAERIAAFCLADTLVRSVRVRIEKPDVIASARSVGIEIERVRAD
jgi:7,8-dihydroneopterin aldolase/epimerase/oxygenase